MARAQILVQPAVVPRLHRFLVELLFDLLAHVRERAVRLARALLEFEDVEALGGDDERAYLPRRERLRRLRELGLHVVGLDLADVAAFRGRRTLRVLFRELREVRAVRSFFLYRLGF